MVDRRHAPVRSAGRYSAFDPELQLWVAATLARTGETIRERVFGPMDPATRERVYRESWVLGTALQVTPGMWPPTRAEFEDYWQASMALLAPDPAVQRLRPALLSSRAVPLPLRPAQPLQSLVTRGNLDARTRERAGPAVVGAGPGAVRPVLAPRSRRSTAGSPGACGSFPPGWCWLTCGAACAPAGGSSER